MRNSGQEGREGQERERGSAVNNARAVGAWLGAPVCLVVLWLLADVFVSTAPGTALIFGVAALAGISPLIGLFLYVFRG